jgi:hypothetical protein
MMISNANSLMASPAFANASGFNFGDYVTPADLGFFKKLKRAVKKVGRVGGKVYRRVTPKAARRLAGKGFRVVKKAGKFVVELHMLPFKLMMKLALRIGKILCAVPQPVVVAAYAGAVPGTNPMHIRMVMTGFCEALRSKGRNASQTIKKLLPQVLKIAAKVAAAGAVPGLGPVLAIAENIPGVGKYLRGADAGPTDQSVMEDMENLATLLGADAISIEDLTDADISEALGLPVGCGTCNALGATDAPWTSGDTVNAVLAVSLIAFGGYALYSSARAESPAY